MFVKIGEPPSADPHARWCERTGVSHPLLLDSRFVPPRILSPFIKTLSPFIDSRGEIR